MPSQVKKRKLSEDSKPLLKARNDKAISEFLDLVDSVESSTLDDASTLVTQATSSLLLLKSIQRQALESLKTTNEVLTKKRQEVKQQTVLLQNLQYEKKYLQGQVQTDFATPHLDRICRGGAEQKKKQDISIEQARNLVLCGSVGASFEDPANHDTVMASLHKEINARGTLERDVNLAEKELVETRKRVLKKQNFLKDLPRKLEDVEQASLPLQTFLRQSSLKSSSGTTHLIGTDRRKRLEHARTLSASLYTLFVQLQSYLDASPEDPMSLEISTPRQSPVLSDDGDDEWFQVDSQALLLHMPLPGVPKGYEFKRITVEFQYLPRLRIVAARATGSLDKAYLSTLLVNLFPGDTGAFTWSAENVNLKDIDSRLPGRPFHWCNYIAGLHLPATHSAASSEYAEPLQLSTKTVCRELSRRLQSHVTLADILKKLEGRKLIPTHPLFREEWKEATKACEARLVGWAETDGRESKSPYERSFLAIVKRQTTTLNATVTLDPTRYPSKPPTWSLLKGEENWGEKHGMVSSLELGTTPLFDSTLAAIENAVNSEFRKLVKEEVEETYDWILAHQLGKVIQLWDESQSSLPSGDASDLGRTKFSGVSS